MPNLLPAEDGELRRCEAVIEGGLKTFVEVGTSLLKIRDGRLYRAEHGTFEDYCRDRWGIARNYANKLIGAAEVVSNLGTVVPNLPTTESQARPLVSLPPEQQVEAWTLAVESAPNGKPTAKIVEAAVAEVTGRDVAPTRASVAEMFSPTNGHAKDLPGQTLLWTREEDTAERGAVEAEEPDPFAPTPNEAHWLKFFDRLNQFFVSLPRRGGIVNLARNWDRKQRQSAIAHLEMLRDAAEQCLAELKEKPR